MLVASGDPTRSSVVLWCRTGHHDAHVTFHVWEEDLDEKRVQACTDCEEGSHRTRVEGLPAGRRHRFEARSAEAVGSGAFSTIPTAGPVRFAVACCAKYNAGYFTGYRTIAERDDLHFVLHLGDYIYEAANKPPRSQTPGAGIGRDMVPLHECTSLEDYRARYEHYRTDDDLNALHRAHAIIATIDDHELADNAWRGGADEHHPDEDGPWSERVSVAMRAWHEWMPTTRTPHLGGDIHHAVDLGDAGTLIVLETRRERDKQADPPTQLGVRQLSWFEEQLASARRVVLGLPSMLTPIWNAEFGPDLDSALRALKLVEPSTGAPFHDLWDCYGQERSRLLDLLDRLPEPALLLSGDVHISAASHPREGGPHVEWTVPSLTSQNLDDKEGRAAGGPESVVVAEAFCSDIPGATWCDVDRHGFLVVEASEQGARGEWWLTDNPRDPGASYRLVRTEILA
jgi:alkaline phosphatase D